MSNFTKFAFAAAMAIPAVAFAQIAPELNQVPINSGAARTAPEFMKLTKAKKSPAKLVECADLIEEENLPDGKVINLLQSGEAYKLYFGQPQYTEYAGISTELVEGNDGYVYLKNPFSQFTTDSYIKGKKEGNTYVFDLPRTIFPNQRLYGVSFNEYITLVQYNKDTQTYIPTGTTAAKDAGLEDIENKLVLNINADGSFSFVPDADYSVIIGMANPIKETWNGYAELKTTWVPFSDDVVTPPAGLTTTEMALTYDGTGHYVKVGYDGDDVYVQGIFEILPDAWVKGEKAGNTVTFAGGQYMGYYDYDNAQVYFTTMRYEARGTGYAYGDIDEITFTIDENGNFTTGDEAILCTPGKDAVTMYYAMHSPMIKPIKSDINPNPAVPYGLEYFDEGGQNIPSLQFYLPNVNVEGDLLNVNNLVYSIYVDGEPYTFKPDIYKYLDFNKRYIPYGYYDGYDFLVRDNQRAVYLYFRGEEMIGVRLFNIDPETQNILGQSELVEIPAKPTNGVDDIYADKTVEGVEYYTIDGYRVANPANGMFIKVVTYTDGTKQTVKEMIK